MLVPSRKQEEGKEKDFHSLIRMTPEVHTATLSPLPPMLFVT